MIGRAWRWLLERVTQRERLARMREESERLKREAEAERLRANVEGIERVKILENTSNVVADGLRDAGLEKNASEAYQSAALLANKRRALEVKVGKERALMDGMFGERVSVGRG